MKLRIVFLLTIILALGCSVNKSVQVFENKENPIIKKIYLKDIEIRELDARTDTVNLESYDKIHREQIFNLLAENKVISPIDKIRAAWILQHTAGKMCDGELSSLSSENFLLAYKLSSSALSELLSKNDTALIRKENIARITALNYDRYLLFSYGYQKFGTQFVFDDKTGEMLLAPIDTTLSNDEERKKYNVQSLNQLRLKYKMKPFVKN